MIIMIKHLWTPFHLKKKKDTTKKINFHPKIYEITMEVYSDEDGREIRERNTSRRVTIPDETMKKLSSEEQYPFYLFYDEDGLEIIIQYDVILEIRRVVV